MAKQKKSTTKRERSERRFLPQSSSNPWLVRIPGALGAAGIGAGVWGYLYGHLTPLPGEAGYNIPLLVMAGGAVVLAVGIWFGTSSDGAVRVGDPGIAYEKGDLRRMPWWRVQSVSWESGSESLLLAGADEHDTSFTFKVSLKSHPEAAAWIVKEAAARIPKKLSLPEDVRERFPEASELAGTRILLEPLQVVGRRCVVSKKLLAFEPDARVCPACERIYFKDNVPKRCACRADLTALRSKKAEEES